MFVFDKLKKEVDIYFYNNKILSQEYIYSWPLIGGPCPCYRPVTPSLWPRPYSSPVSTTPCWRGSPPPGTKPDSGSYKANIYNLDIYNNFVQMLYVSLWWSALRFCNLCIPPGRDFLSHQGYLNAVSKSTIPVRVIVLWIVTNLQWYTQLSYLVTCSHRDGAGGQPWTDSPVPHCVRGQVPRPPGESTGTSHRCTSDSR